MYKPTRTRYISVLVNIKVFLVVTVIALLLGVTSAKDSKRCSLLSDIELFTFDGTSQSFVPHVIKSNHTSAGSPYSYERNNTSYPVYRMRLCSCSPSPATRTYCMDNTSNYCELSTDATVVCYYENKSSGYLKNTFTISILWYGALVIFFMTTDNGKHTRNYLLSKICPHRNRQIARRLLEEELRILDRMQSFGFSQHRPSDSLGFVANDANEQEELVLKTSVYHSVRSPRKRDMDHKHPPETPATLASHDSFGLDQDPDNDHGCSIPLSEECKSDNLSLEVGHHQSPTLLDGIPCEIRETASTMQVVDEDSSGFVSENTEDDKISCSICLNIVEDGERIGALSCNHIFHSDCLKTWLRCRNVCPLCLAPDVAELRPNLRISSSSVVSTTPTNISPRSASELVDWNGSPSVTAFRLQQPSGRVRIIYRLERPAPGRARILYQDHERSLSHIFSGFISNSPRHQTSAQGRANSNIRDEEAGNS